MKALVVEDEFTSRKLLQMILLQHGECDIAVNGNEALQAFKLAWEHQEPYDLICLDINIPELSGYQALEQMRIYEETQGIETSQQVKAIMVTGREDKDSVIASFRSGCEAYLVKPIQPQELSTTLEELDLLGYA